MIAQSLLQERSLNRIFVFFLIFSCCSIVHAEDGLVVHFTIKKTEGSEISSYTNGILMRLTEATTATFAHQYEIRLDAKAANDGLENIVVTLKDISTGKPIYAGSGQVAVKVGASATIPFHQLSASQATYEVFLDTSFGALPEK